MIAETRRNDLTASYVARHMLVAMVPDKLTQWTEACDQARLPCVGHFISKLKLNSTFVSLTYAHNCQFISREQLQAILMHCKAVQIFI